MDLVNSPTLIRMAFLLHYYDELKLCQQKCSAPIRSAAQQNPSLSFSFSFSFRT